MLTYSKKEETFAALAEGFSAVAVHHPEDPPGLWTVGYGTTQFNYKDPNTGLMTNHKVWEGMELTEDQALTLLDQGLDHASDCVNHSVTFPVTQDEFDSIVDLVYNIGCSRWLTSTARNELNRGDIHGAILGFLMWDKAAGKTMVGLLRRRQQEALAFQAMIHPEPSSGQTTK